MGSQGPSKTSTCIRVVRVPGASGWMRVSWLTALGRCESAVESWLLNAAVYRAGPLYRGREIKRHLPLPFY
jgi:hypothetical protein